MLESKNLSYFKQKVLKMSKLHENHLLLLFASVLAPILSEWISDEDLCCLDTSVCSENLRPCFLRILERCNIVNTPLTGRDKIFDIFKSWLLLRGLGLKKYCVDNRNAHCEQLFKNKHVYKVLCSSYNELSCFLSMSVTFDHLVVNCSSWWNTEDLALVGVHITEIINCKYGSFRLSTPQSCPNLLSIDGCWCYETAMATIDHCQFLDTIYSMNIRTLIEKKKVYDNSNMCDFKRALVMDDSSVCLREGKYFNLTGLDAKEDLWKEDLEFLIPLVRHLSKVILWDHSELFCEIAVSSFNLTHLGINPDSFDEEDVLLLLTHSPNLNKFEAKESSKWNLDGVVRILSQHCPQLEVFSSKTWVESVGAFLSLLDKCPLKKFDCNFRAKGLVLSSPSLLSSARHSATLELGSLRSKKTLIPLLHRCARIEQLVILYGCSSDDWNVALRNLPRLTSVVYKSPREFADVFNFKSNAHLTSLSLSKFQPGRDFCPGYKGVIRLPRKSKLLTLELKDCGYKGDDLVGLCNFCPSLTALLISGNASIKNRHVTSLLKVCPKLEYLRLKKCSCITVDGLKCIRSTSLKTVDVTKTIKEEELWQLRISLPFRVVCSWL